MCPAGTSYAIDTGASIGYTVGVDAGYYVAYAGAGHWHFEWTCDTKLSAQGCNFTGTITAPAVSNATCYQCEPNDLLNVTATSLVFDTVTSTGIDGVDFTTTPGAAIHVDLQIDGLYQNDLVYLPSGGRTATPACMPVELVPSAP